MNTFLFCETQDYFHPCHMGQSEIVESQFALPAMPISLAPYTKYSLRKLRFSTALGLPTMLAVTYMETSPQWGKWGSMLWWLFCHERIRPRRRASLPSIQAGPRPMNEVRTKLQYLPAQNPTPSSLLVTAPWQFFPFSPLPGKKIISLRIPSLINQPFRLCTLHPL